MVVVVAAGWLSSANDHDDDEYFAYLPILGAYRVNQKNAEVV